MILLGDIAFNSLDIAFYWDTAADQNLPSNLTYHSRFLRFCLMVSRGAALDGFVFEIRGTLTVETRKCKLKGQSYQARGMPLSCFVVCLNRSWHIGSVIAFFPKRSFELIVGFYIWAPLKVSTFSTRPKGLPLAASTDLTESGFTVLGNVGCELVWIFGMMFWDIYVYWTILFAIVCYLDICNCLVLHIDCIGFFGTGIPCIHLFLACYESQL